MKVNKKIIIITILILLFIGLSIYKNYKTDGVCGCGCVDDRCWCNPHNWCSGFLTTGYGGINYYNIVNYIQILVGLLFIITIKGLKRD